MLYRIVRTTLIVKLVLFIIVVKSFGQTVGTLINDELASDGYTLFAPLSSTDVYLINNCGDLIHKWNTGYTPGNSVYLLENGNLLHTGFKGNDNFFHALGGGGIVELLDWESNVLWNYELDTGLVLQHHDVEPLPNGNILVLFWDQLDSLQTVNNGRDPDNMPEKLIWPEGIVEIDPSKPVQDAVVWEWHLYDHLIQDFDPDKNNYGNVSEHPELVDINYVVNPYGDWVHANAIAYNAELDQVMISSRNFDEIWIIDHSTSIEEAKSHSGGNSGKGGDLIYRWGNPVTYKKGTLDERRLFGQHNPHWVPSGHIEEGKIIIFNNGADRVPAFTSIDFIDPPRNENGNYFLNENGVFDPAEEMVLYRTNPPTDFFASFISGVQELPNGNLLMCSGPNGTFTEVTRFGDKVWKYVNPVTTRGILDQGESIVNGPAPDNLVFRCTKYPVDYPAFSGKDLTPGDPIEGNPNPCVVTNDVDIVTSGDFSSGGLLIYPNPVTGQQHIKIANPGHISCTAFIYDLAGKMKTQFYINSQFQSVPIGDYKPGIYFLVVPEISFKYKIMKLE